MRAFLKSIDDRIWLAVINGWTSPTVITGEVIVTKPISAWDRVDYDNCGWNNKVMNAIYNGVTAEEFRRISNCEIAKEAWDILQITHEGTTTVKIAKFQRLTTAFKILRMEDDENFDQFYFKLSDTVNSGFNLGEQISPSKIVRKILRSLPERF